MSPLSTTDTLLFDLDGTLLDTAVDMVGALNRLLENHGEQAVPVAQMRPYVSRGAIVLVQMGFGIEEVNDRAKALWHEFLDIYQANLCLGTQLFDGMGDVLDRIESSGRRWGIVTNKPGYLTDPLLQQLDLADRAACVVSGDTLDKRKPWPDPLLHACELAATTPERCIYIGDDERDIEAGRRAGMPTVAARYGYIPPGTDPDQWGADRAIDRPADLLSWLQDDAPPSAT